MFRQTPNRRLRLKVLCASFAINKGILHHSVPCFANQTFMHGQPVPPQFGPPPSQYGPPPPHYGPPFFQPQQTQYGPPRQRRKPRDRNTVQCWTCKQWGHYQYECLKNQGNSGGPAHNQ